MESCPQKTNFPNLCKVKWFRILFKYESGHTPGFFPDGVLIVSVGGNSRALFYCTRRSRFSPVYNALPATDNFFENIVTFKIL